MPASKTYIHIFTFVYINELVPKNHLGFYTHSYGLDYSLSAGAHMNLIKQTITGIAIWSAKISSMALLLAAGLVFGVWASIQALAYII